MTKNSSKKPKSRKENPALISAFHQLSVRFFLNLPKEELNSFDRIFYQLNQALWFYEDYLRVEDPALPSLPLRQFCECFFQHCEILKPYLEKFEECFKQFQKYLRSVPVYGCMILNPENTKVLLVKGWGGHCWGFPKGKIDHSESDMECAAREVYEEVGVQVLHQLDHRNRLTGHVGGKAMTLFIVPGISEKTVFQTRTIKEISEIKWFSVHSLLKKSGSKPHRNVIPFIVKLDEWIRKQNGSKKKRSPVDADNSLTFGESTAGWNPERMFAENELLKLSSDSSPMSDSLSDDAVSDLLGSESERWTVEDMFQYNQDLYGVKICKISDLDDLSQSMAQAGSGYKSYTTGKKPHETPKKWSYDSNVASSIIPSLSSSNPCLYPGESKLPDTTTEFRFDTSSVMQALVSALK